MIEKTRSSTLYKNDDESFSYKFEIQLLFQNLEIENSCPIRSFFTFYGLILYSYLSYNSNQMKDNKKYNEIKQKKKSLLPSSSVGH